MRITPRIERSFARDGIGLFIFARDDEGNRSVLRPLIDLSFSPIPEGIYPDYDAAAWLQNTEAQLLMDDLWNAGVRPTEGRGSAGQLTAVQAHLKDLQEIVRTYLPKALRK